MKKTLVVGGSENPERYSNRAIKKLRQHGHPVLAYALKAGRVEDVDILDVLPAKEENLDTITVYVSSSHLRGIEDRLIDLKPKRIVLNPGAENDLLSEKANAAGIEVLEACTLVLLSIGDY